jgi:hypothetical protein
LRAWGGVLITAGLTLFVANAFDLTIIPTLGSAGLLLIFTAVNTTNARKASHTKSRGWISAAGIIAFLVAFGALVWQMSQTRPTRLWFLAAMVLMTVIIEGIYGLTKGEIHLHE